MDKSLVILKPDAVERFLIGAIVGRLEAVGLRMIATKLMRARKEILCAHYPDDSLAEIVGLKAKEAGADVGDDVVVYGRRILEWNRTYMMRGPVLAMVLQGHGAIQRIRDMVGSTNPPKACPGTIRFDYGVDSIEQANAEQRATENLVHASGSADEAKLEISLWFPELP